MMDAIKVAIIATSHSSMGTGGEADATGVWLEELTTPYYAMADAGLEIDVFSIDGGAIPFDPRSTGEDETAASVVRYREDEDVQAIFADTRNVGAVDADDYDVVFLPGGHGTMFDYPESPALKAVVERALTTDTVMAAVCHGPAGLTTAVDADGVSLLKGRKVAGFTNSEEDGVGLTEAMPFLLETRLKDLGADYVSGPDWEPFAVRDGLLVTGQNPASAQRVTELVLEALAERDG